MATAQPDLVSEAYDALQIDTPEDDEPQGQELEPDGIDDEADSDDEPEQEGEFVAEDDEEPDDPDEDGDEDDEEPDEGPEQFTVKVDGEELTVDLDELRSGYQRHADYTRKTQELSEQREQLEQDRQTVDQERERVENFISAFDSNPVDVVEKLVTRTSNPTLMVAKLIRSMADSQLLEEDFARTFVGDNYTLQRKADQAEGDDRYRQLEQRLEQREQAERQERERQETIQQFEQQWSTVVDTAGLEFGSPQEEQELLRSVLSHALEREITNLEDAYASYAFKSGLQQQKPQASKQKKQSTEKKRANQAITRRSASSGQFQRKKPETTEDAIRESLEEILAGA